MAASEETLPLFAEEISVGVHKVATGRTRVRVTPTTTRETIPVSLTETAVQVERVPVGRYVDAMPPARTEGDTTILPVVEEQAVVTTRLFLREEVRIRVVRATRTESQTLDLRREDVAVERLPPEQGEEPQ